uniref:Uncharacterized protein n=1 Tax=Magallana gigas TaxID=29159 RepID=A0A8W8M9B6_MAGGI
MKQRPSVFVPTTFLLVALFVMFSGAQRIYHSQEWPSNDCENDNQILKEIKNVINELTHLVKHLQNKELGQINNVAFYAQLTTSMTDDYVILQFDCVF